MRRTGSLFLLLLFAFSSAAHEMPSGNLAVLGRIWGIVRHAHPWIGDRDVELDAAALRAIARVRGTSDAATLTAAVDEMLDALRDDASFVSRPCFEEPAATVDRRTRMLSEHVAYVSATAPSSELLRNARAVVVDLRPQPGRCSAPAISHELIPMLVRGTVARTDHRKVRNHGWRNAAETPFDTSFTTIDLGHEQGAAETLTKVVFIVDERSDIPPFAADVAASEVAQFVSVGRFPLHSAVDHCQMVMPDNSIITLRTSQLIDDDGYSAEPAAMVTLAANASESDVLAAAEKLARPRSVGRRRSVGFRPVRMADYRWRPDEAFAQSGVPTPEQRILAAYRIWNVVHFLHGSREQLEQWQMDFPHIIAMLEQATTRSDYEHALAEIMAMLPDGQASVALTRDTATPPFQLLPVEGKPVVVHGTDVVKPGDELLRIDGRDVASSITELARITPAATEHARQAAILRELTAGAVGSTSTFAFRRPDGTTYDVTLPRAQNSAAATAKAWRTLDGNIAYADLRTLEAADVATMFDDIANTRALILDLRGTTRANHDELLARIRTGDSAVATITWTPQLVGGAYLHAESATVIDDVPRPRYTGRIIALIDARTQGRAEEIALATSALAGAKFAGSPAAGTAGAVTSLVVPGDIEIRFTGSAVRHAKGFDLVPDAMVLPTVRGVAEGRDEVLERALRLVDEP